MTMNLSNTMRWMDRLSMTLIVGLMLIGLPTAAVTALVQSL
jgi:hypothetical protein